MALVNRLAGIEGEEENKLGVATFHGCLYELAGGYVTLQQVIDYFDLDAGEQSELTWLITQYNANPTAEAKSQWLERLRIVFYLAETQVPGYSSNVDLVAKLTV